MVMGYDERQAISQQAELLFHHYCHHDDADLFCSEQCPFAALCDSAELMYGCGVWEQAMGEDL